MRIPLLTPVLLVLTALMYCATLAFPMWAKVENNGTESDVGVMMYKINECNTTGTTSDPTHIDEYQWIFSLDCKGGDLSVHNSNVCKTFFRISFPRTILHGLAIISLLHALYNIFFGSGTILRPYFLSLVLGITSFVLFLASYDHTRIPCTFPSAEEDALLVGESEDSNTFTFRSMFYVHIAAIFFNIATVVQHASTCTRRKFEEL
eukprot:TRINITY_DN18952_c0_g1_i1.p1 TRINITY_DN18952_c0_g1~~TRINITY_DN18952_c0_g1_i1.p1  ORF type:complete len:206 (+),score=81.79 TRINITY_DN18952_c0_g1_i1:188-805(+)